MIIFGLKVSTFKKSFFHNIYLLLLHFMKSILLLGAGKSATVLIEYLGKYADEQGHRLVVCDRDLTLAKQKTQQFTAATPLPFDVTDDSHRKQLIKESDVVISMLPPELHIMVAKDCIRFAKHLLTPSYSDEAMKQLAPEIKKSGILFIEEMGLDPGIDHMSASKMIHELKSKGAKITSFKSHCGGLVAPESDDNPWHYKITWNPANIIIAGSAGAQYLENGREVQIPYKKVFSFKEQMVMVPGLGDLAWYANRDSLSYLKNYDLKYISTFIRTTLRHPAFCQGWNVFVNMGLTQTDDAALLREMKTVSKWYQTKKERFLSGEPNEAKVESMNTYQFKEQVAFLELETDTPIGDKQSSAALFQQILEDKLSMHPQDKDMIVMLHEMEYELEGPNKITSTLVVKGRDSMHTAVAATVGLPLAISAKLILEDKIQLRGLHIPLHPEIYLPVLKELERIGIKFAEQTTSLVK